MKRYPRCLLTAVLFSACGVALNSVLSAGAFAAGARSKIDSFQGDWDIRRCRSGVSGGDCGGLSVRIFQKGSLLCGTYTGATPGLEQVDEGDQDAILGQVVGRVAIFAVRGGRSGEVRLVKAELMGSKLRWRVLQTVSPPLQDGEHDDTMIIGTDELLSRKKTADSQPSAECLVRFAATN